MYSPFCLTPHVALPLYNLYCSTCMVAIRCSLAKPCKWQQRQDGTLLEGMADCKEHMHHILLRPAGHIPSIRDLRRQQHSKYWYTISLSKTSIQKAWRLPCQDLPLLANSRSMFVVCVKFIAADCRCRHQNLPRYARAATRTALPGPVVPYSPAVEPTQAPALLQ